MKRKLTLAVALGCAAAIFLGTLGGTPTLAKGGKKAANNNNNNNTNNQTPPPAPTPASDSSSGSGAGSMGVPENATPLDAAKKALAQAQADYDTLVAAKKAEFEAGDDFKAAKKALDDDQAALDSLEAPLREQLKASDSHYAAALEGLEPAKKKLEEALASKNADDITFRKYDVNHMQEVITNAETPVFSKDAGVMAAQAKLDADKKVMATMQQKFEDFLNANSDYVAVKRALANAQVHVATLENTAGAP